MNPRDEAALIIILFIIFCIFFLFAIFSGPLAVFGVCLLGIVLLILGFPEPLMKIIHGDKRD